MNRSGLIDSKLSLDVLLGMGEPFGMLIQPYHLYTERKDPARNMARYYAMDISQDLFGQACLTRRWGRIGSPGQRIVHHFVREGDAVKLFLEIARLKRARGYRPIAGTQQKRVCGAPPSHRIDEESPEALQQSLSNSGLRQVR